MFFLYSKNDHKRRDMNSLNISEITISFLKSVKLKDDNINDIINNKNINWDTILNEIKILAKDFNNECAQYVLGFMYDEGNGVEQDYKKAIEWYTKPALQNNSSAQNNLGYMYQYGKGVKKDYKKAVELYTKAVLQNDSYAQNNLGFMYRYGLGVEQDHKKAIEWYTKAASQNNSHAQINLKILLREIAFEDILSIFQEKDELKESNEQLKESNEQLKESVKHLENEILELKLRPPEEGGVLYQEHKTHFDENIKVFQ